MTFNGYAIVVLAALLCDYVLKGVADWLNLRAMDAAVPDAVADLYDPDDRQRAHEYAWVRTRFAILATTFDLVLLLAFWGVGGFAHLDHWARSLGLGEVWTGLVYIGLLALATSLLDLPFRYYSTFGIEQRFGFNRTDHRTFWLDHAKAALLAIGLGGPLLALVLFLFDRFGPGAWVYGWTVTILFLLAVQYLAPAWIMPLFLRFTPLEDGELREAILALARRVGFPVRGIYVTDGSRRSTKANAFFTGLGRHKRIALFDTLVDGHPVDEVVAVVAHEIGHYKRRHVLQGTLLSIAHTGLLFGLLSLCLTRPGLFAAFGVEHLSVYAGLVFFGLLYTPVEMILSLLLRVVSRRNEYQADRFAVAATGDWRPLAAGLKRLSRDHLANLTPHPLYVALHYSHPPLAQRLTAMQG
ncbi:MAG: M48 family metallopeptidase [Nitrospirota bacterium]|jgi:STE24 endopeptidase